MSGGPSTNPVKSAMRTLDLIELVVGHPRGLVAQEIATALSIPVSSLSYLLATLVERGYLRREGRRYHPGAGLDRLVRPANERSLADVAMPYIKGVRMRLNETTSLFTPVDRDMEAVVTETAEQTLRYSIDVGRRSPMHCVASGKAYLSALPADELDRYLAGDLPEPRTPQTVTDKAALVADLAEARAAGFARSDGEYMLGISGVGVALLADGRPFAAISVGLPSARLDNAAAAVIVAELERTARALESAWLSPARA